MQQMIAGKQKNQPVEWFGGQCVQQVFDEKSIDIAVKSSHKVKAGDRVSVVYSYPKQTNELIPQDIPINIHYEDDDILIVNKEAGMVVHPGFGNYDGTLVNALAFHFENLPNKSTENRPGLVHRIDKNTSGILVIAKNDNSMLKLSKKFEERDLNRLYIALVWGDLKNESDTITGHILSLIHI